MLARTRPPSRILLWPRSSRAVVRFTTTSTASSHEDATARSEDVGGGVVGTPKKRFAHIRKLDSALRDPAVRWAGKYTIRRLKRNTEPVVPRAPWTKLEEVPGEAEPSPALTTKTWTPTGRVTSQDTPAWAENNNAKRHPAKRSACHERASQTVSGDDKLSGAYIGTDTEARNSASLGQWTPFTLNPDVAVKSSSPPEHPPTFTRKPFTLNPDFAANRHLSPAHTKTSPSSSSPQKKDVEPVRSKDGAPARAEILGEMRTWNFETAPTTLEAVIQESDVVAEDDGPPRSKIIGEMTTWNFEVQADAGNQEATPKPPRRVRQKRTEVLPPLDREFREWLIAATDAAVEEAERNRANTNNIAVYDGPTVLVLNAASRSLLESDFYRLARQGKHLGDWVVGIARVVQARDPATYEPLGKYYVFFHTRAAALAYSEEVRRLHELARRQAHLVSTSLSSDSIPGPLPLAPALINVDRGAEADLDAALRGYTLLPHSARLDLKLHLCKDLPTPPEDRLSRMNRDLGDDPSPSSYLAAQEHHFVLVSLEGCKTTVAALHAAIGRDGEERGLPWALAATRRDGKPSSIAAIAPDDDDGPETTLADDDATGNQQRRFWRFVVPFADAAEARRFVRNWHRREMRDLEGRNMVVVFNVTALW